ncbi:MULTISPECIES: GTP cyclohydrolase I FolE [Roseivirga]|mgnify:CR=1 FL=1|jgi:GTP cyclohydrolase I|uniref:GTP cyclohydrolase 1 n=1 Tax=Roseivirga spongicola TaxID=333140 RepID=A0A150WZL2_9BACT|nr:MULTISPECIES: GTP cyclohydrolase I FolE [Roseivirga]PWL28010.1 MAG: GTP cyclohydrolase I FolE [Roseivirga sp. XM-24bin3]KYG71913.1 GTP cyclohydrolase [Roseivirga spongicola]MBO6496328.1 GTP cyclohydrolase I FolE [Roseivirga sp.]MBO6662104.1 GTP cyclohydrolase I FolE [Roseivirga sp.]MBO6761421.1 GTP cyclohydrolase I FolE [Roseivirga sp.]
MEDKSTKVSDELLKEVDEIGDNHIMTSIATPMREDAFELSDEEKIEKIQGYFEKIMHTLGLDLTDDSLKGTPKRVAKLYIKDLFKGLDPANKPSMSTFENKYNYNQMLVEKNITVYSNCEHHFLPIVGRAHVAYIPNGNVIGLSKINRIVDYYARRPQVQERLALQVLNELKEALNTEDVAVYVDAEHMCISSRGVSDQHSSTVTVEYSGKFQEEATKKEFLTYINDKLK